MAERVNLPTQVRLPRQFLEDMVKKYGKGVVDYFEERDFIQYQLFRKTGGSSPLPTASEAFVSSNQPQLTDIIKRIGTDDPLTSDETGFTVDADVLSVDMTEQNPNDLPVAEDGEQGEAGPQGATGATGDTGAAGVDGAGGAITFPYEVDTSGDTSPATGKITWNDTTQIDATQVFLSFTDKDGLDIKSIVQDFYTIGNVFLIQKKDDANVFQKFEITGTTDNGAYSTIDVSFVSGAAQFGNQLQIQATVSITGGGGQGVPVGGATGQVLTKINSDDYNTQWATPGGGGSVYSFNRLIGATTQAVTSTLTAITWSSSSDSSGSDVTFSGGNPTRLTAVSAGTYKVGGYVTIQSAAQRAQTAIEIMINGTATGFQRSGTYLRNSGTAYDFWTMELSCTPFTLAASDFVELAVGQVTGATYGYNGGLTITCDRTVSEFWLERVA